MTFSLQSPSSVLRLPRKGGREGEGANFARTAFLYLFMLTFQRTANALRALSRMGSLGGLMAGGGKGGASAGSAAAPKPGGFLKKVKEEKAKEEAQETATKPEPRKEPVRIFKDDPRKTTGDSLTPAGPLGPSLSGRRSPALSGRRSPVSRAEARKYSTPESTTPSTRASTCLNVLVHLSNQLSH